MMALQAVSQNGVSARRGRVAIAILGTARLSLLHPSRWCPTRPSETMGPSGRCRQVCGCEGPRHYVVSRPEVKGPRAMLIRDAV